LALALACRRGAAEKTKGKVQKGVGDLKDAARNALKHWLESAPTERPQAATSAALLVF